MGRRRTRAFLGVALLLGGGCRLMVSLDDLRGGPALDDGGSEAASDVTSPDAVAESSADTSTPDVFDSGPDVRDARGTTDRFVACQASPTCALQTQQCCIVYDNVSDYCYDAAVPGDCAFGTSKVVKVPCDDDQDCAEQGMGGTVCCGFTVNPLGGGFTSIECVLPAACTGNAVRLCDSVEKLCPAGGTCGQGPNSGPIWECH